MTDEAKGQTKVDTGTERFLIAAALYTALVALALGHQLGSNGLLADASALWRELHWSEGRPWGMGLDEPFCYRPLFRVIVLGVCAVVGWDPSITYGVFLVLSALSLLAAAGVFDVLLGRLGFSSSQRLVGVALFLLGFPILFSHDIPIQTREDLLGYALIAATLVAVVDDRPILVGLLGAVGATVRETCLLGVLPLVLVSRRRWQDLVPAYLLPFLALVLVRLAQAPAGPRVSLVELAVSSTKPARERPLEALLYAFAAFGALWLAAGLRLADRKIVPRHPLLAPRVVGAACASVVLFGWVFGMVRENRITYVLFPFVVPLALDWLWTHGAALRRPAAMVTGLVVLVAGAVGIAWLREDALRVGVLFPWIGDCFNPGVPPIIPMLDDYDQPFDHSLYFASALQGPVVVMHLALAAAIAVAAALERWSPLPVPAAEGPTG